MQSDILNRLRVITEQFRRTGGSEPENEDAGGEDDKRDNEKNHHKIARPVIDVECHATMVKYTPLPSFVWAKVSDLNAYFPARIADNDAALLCD
jgi:hypothetical protein